MPNHGGDHLGAQAYAGASDECLPEAMHISESLIKTKLYAHAPV
jgi:hypothetical protein